MIFGTDELTAAPLFPLDFYFAVVLCILNAFSGKRALVMLYAEVF